MASGTIKTNHCETLTLIPRFGTISTSVSYAIKRGGVAEIVGEIIAYSGGRAEMQVENLNLPSDSGIGNFAIARNTGSGATTRCDLIVTNNGNSTLIGVPTIPSGYDSIRFHYVGVEQ